jgi:hypothetical protein
MVHHHPVFALCDTEAEAASLAVSLEDGEECVIMGVQYDDGRVIAREAWPVFLAEIDRREAERKARAAAYVPPAGPRHVPRVIRDPFEHFTLEVHRDTPAWLGVP